MNLGEIRSKFITFSGRDDLVNSDDSDNGANFFINAGQRFLDRKIDFRGSGGSVFKKLAVDSWYLSVENCRSIESVWVNDSESRWKLTKKDLKWLKEEFPSLISATDSGDSLYWGISNIRGVDVAVMNSLGSLFSHVVSETSSQEINGITILPATDAALVVEIVGKFYSSKMVEDEDTSYWSVVAEETLLMAALYRLELFYRNTEGAKDWLAGIELDLLDIDKDTVHEENKNVAALEG